MVVAKVKAVKKPKPAILKVFDGRAPVLPQPVKRALAFLKEAENNSGYYKFEYGVIKDNLDVHHSTNHACHAQMANMPINSKAVWSKFPAPRIKGQIAHEEILAFNDYLVKRSPWHKCTVPVTGEFATKKGFVCMVDQPANYMVNFLMATRMVSEHTGHVKMWNKLVKAGVPEDIAVMFGCLLSDQLKIGDNNGWHHHPFERLSKPLVENFVRHEFKQPSKLYKDNQNYMPCTAGWGGMHEEGYGAFLRKTYPTKKATASSRMFNVDEQVQMQYHGATVEHSFDEWVAIAIIEDKRIKDVKKAVKAQAPRVAKRRAKAA